MRSFKGKVISDWGKIDFTKKEDLLKFRGAFNAFFAAPDRNPKLKAAIQAFATKGDFPAEIMQVLEKFHSTPSYDLGYEQIFDIRDFTGTTESGFDILSVSSGLVFAKVPTGGKAKVFKFTGDKVTVSFDKYGGALGWDKVLMDDGKYWTMEDNAIEFRNKAYAARSQAFYDLLDAVTSANNVAWQAATPVSVPSTNENYDAIRDINTINYACNAILRAVKDKGYGVTAQSVFVVVAPIELKSRLLRAVSLIQQAVAGSEKRSNFNIQFVWTMMLASTSTYYVVLPKVKMKGGYRMDLTLLGDTNILEYTEEMAGWMRYGGGIGDTDQVRRCAIS